MLKTGIKAGAAVSLMLFPVTVLLISQGLNVPLPASLTAGLALALVAFMAVYLAVYMLYSRRIEKLKELLEAISEKKFDDLPRAEISGNDEVDGLLRESGRAAETIEIEFQRMLRLENYRKDFIGDISHELKTPIFAIQGFVETLLDGALEDREVNRHFLSKTMKNVNRLTILTNDLMEIAKLETGELKSHVMPIYLADTVQEVHDTLYYRADEEEVSLDLSVDDRQTRVMADRNQIRQVLINLVENAIKYNKKGGSVELRVSRQSPASKKVKVTVKDTGIGIAPEHINRLTERFFRVDKSRSRGKGGTGLGLSIVKHILESHGTELAVKSEPGKGSEFSFFLRLAEEVSG